MTLTARAIYLLCCKGGVDALNRGRRRTEAFLHKHEREIKPTRNGDRHQTKGKYRLGIDGGRTINIGWLLITSSHIHQKWWRIKKREGGEGRGERSDMRNEGEMEREGRRRGGREAKRYVWGRLVTQRGTGVV